MTDREQLIQEIEQAPDAVVVARVLGLPKVVLPLVVAGELLFGAENSSRPLHNLSRYLEFIAICEVVPLGREAAAIYAHNRLTLKRRKRSGNGDRFRATKQTKTN